MAHLESELSSSDDLAVADGASGAVPDRTVGWGAEVAAAGEQGGGGRCGVEVPVTFEVCGFVGPHLVVVGNARARRRRSARQCREM